MLCRKIGLIANSRSHTAMAIEFLQDLHRDFIRCNLGKAVPGYMHGQFLGDGELRGHLSHLIIGFSEPYFNLSLCVIGTFEIRQ